MDKPLSIGIAGTGRFASVLRQMFAGEGFCIYQSSTSKPIDHDWIFPLEKVASCDVVFPCVPIAAYKPFIDEISQLIPDKSNSLFVDICSVSSFPNAWLEDLLPPTTDIVSSHPLFGPISSKNGTVFKNLDFIYWPTRISKPRRWKRILSHLKLLGLTVSKMSPEEHDRVMAKTQAIAFLYGKIGLDLNLHEPRLNTPGYQSIAENQYIVSQDSPDLFWDMFQYNPYAQETLDRIIQQLQYYQNQLHRMEEGNG